MHLKYSGYIEKEKTMLIN
ncbi:hypothetical protein [Tenacibaculum sp. 190524A02b]